MKASPKAITGSALVAVGIALGSTQADAALVLEEQFDYAGVNQPLDGGSGGSGFAGPWLTTGWSRNYETGRTEFAIGGGQTATGNTVNANGGLEFPGLATAGSGLTRFGTAGQRVVQRPVAQPILTTDSTTIWFSVLAGAPSGNKFGTMVFGTDPLMAQQSAPPFPNGNLNAAAGQAFGVGFRTDNAGVAGAGSGSPNAVAFINSDSATVNIGSYTPPINGTHHDTTLIVGKINWFPNGTDDELFLFNITDPSGAEPAEGTAIASLLADFDQSNFDTLSLWDTGASIFDEIRFGTSFADVIPEPSGAALLGLGGLALILRRRR